MDIEALKSQNLIVNDLCHSVCHYEVVFLPNSRHSLSLHCHRCILGIQIDFNYIKLVISGLYDIGLIKPDTLKDDCKLEY